jgi:asparagine synthase (glutamine-hydrolysing)
MCGIAGFCDFTRDNRGLEWESVGEKMGAVLARRGPDDRGLWAGKDCVLAHRRLAVMDPAHGQQPMVRKKEGADWVLVYNGELYNAPALRQSLQAKGYVFETGADTEVVLYAGMEFGENVGEELEGIFAFALWNSATRTLLCCRDRFGVKPFFYAWQGETFLFASEHKALFQYPGFAPQADRQTWCELLGISPARTAGQGTFAGVKELKPAHTLVLSPEGVRERVYWRLESKPHQEDYETSVLHLRELLTGAVQRQLASDVPLCTFLSGGLDSSVITAVAAEEYRKMGLPPLETYSFDYTDNDKYFKASAFQPDADGPWAQRVSLECQTNHTVLTCPVAELPALLEQAVEARDLPGMADVDGSLLWYCRQVSDRHVVAVSGECSDEIFGGYPWFYREEMLNANTFPWCPALSHRTEVLDPHLVRQLELEDYVAQRYAASAAETPLLEGEDDTERKRRQVGWLSIQWFMTALLERKDRMSMYSGLEVRVPFCDHQVVEYVWNLPWAMKSHNGERKGVLRDAFTHLLSNDVLHRPKSPFPKTHHPLYEELLQKELGAVLADPNEPVVELLNVPVLKEGLLKNGGDYGKPWFGQLMAGPQMMAYLLQLNHWMKRFHIRL